MITAYPDYLHSYFSIKTYPQFLRVFLPTLTLYSKIGNRTAPMVDKAVKCLIIYIKVTPLSKIMSCVSGLQRIVLFEKHIHKIFLERLIRSKCQIP